LVGEKVRDKTVVFMFLEGVIQYRVLNRKVNEYKKNNCVFFRQITKMLTISASYTGGPGSEFRFF
jgi:hypothetical protein